MRLNSKFSFDFGEQKNFFYKLLSEEDFDFKTKNITLEINLKDGLVLVNLFAESVLDLKIGSSALIKSLEIIDKTLNI